MKISTFVDIPHIRYEHVSVSNTWSPGKANVVLLAVTYAAAEGTFRTRMSTVDHDDVIRDEVNFDLEDIVERIALFMGKVD